METEGNVLKYYENSFDGFLARLQEHEIATSTQYVLNTTSKDFNDKEEMVRREVSGNTNISTWNVCGKGSPEEVDKLLHQSSEKQSSHIVCVQQANLPTSGTDLPNYRWLCSGPFGSAVLINKSSTLKAGPFEQVCEHICMAEVAIDDQTLINVISCYIPPSADYITKDLWEKLTNLLKRIPGNMMYVIAGDFNAEIGKKDYVLSVDKSMIGPKLYHDVCNENGIQLKKLVLSLHARIASTFGEIGSSKPLITYKDGEEMSQRSHILGPTDRIPFPSKILLQDCGIVWYPDYKSALLTKSIRFNKFENASQVAVGSWNVQGATPASVDKALSDINLPVVCVQDLFLTSDKDLESINYTWYTSKKLWGKNVGILIKKDLEISITDFVELSENLCAGDVTLNGVIFKVVCCSLPSYADCEQFEKVTTDLVALVKNIPDGTMFVVAGDFNTHANYTLIDNQLVFDEGDLNALVLQKLMKECKLELPFTPKNSMTHVSEKFRRSSTFIFMSPNCLWKYGHKRYIRWVPFFESGVVSLHLFESDSDPAHVFANSPDNESPWKKGKVELVDGHIYATKRFCKLKKYLSMSTTDQQAYAFFPPESSKLKTNHKLDLPEDILAKYNNSPPPLDELLRILGNGFTLYHGFMMESCVSKGHLSVLTASFEYLNRGPLIIECIDVLEETTNLPVKKLIKFRWNGIVVYQHEDGKFLSCKRVINNGQAAFLRSLGKHCFTVKARGAFYNEGLPPLFQDEEQLNKVIRVVKRSDFSKKATMEDVKKFINKRLLTLDPNQELMFGPDFSYKQFLEPIKQYASTACNKGCSVRVFKSNKDVDHYDHVVVFVELTPLEIRKKLMKIPEHQDLRFQLIPPCGPDGDYFDWIAQWTDKVIPDEYYTMYATEIPEIPTNGIAEELNKPLSVEDLIKVISRTKKHKVGFVERKVRRVGKQQEHRLMKSSNMPTTNPTVLLPNGRKVWIHSAREESDLPQEVVDKLCETPPTIEQLTRILGDEFTLYYGFNRESCVVSNTQQILAESFEGTGRGGVMMESIDIYKRNAKVPYKRLVKFKWNGICIHKEEGSTTESFKALIMKGQAALIDKLGQHYYTVKAKMSYFKGLYPLCADTEKLNEVFRIVKPSDLPSVELEEMIKFVSEFFSKDKDTDTDVELVFGPDFSFTEYLEPLKKLVTEKELGYRWIKSTESLTSWDSLGVFIKRSPLDIREKLLKIPDHQDLKFFLVPPCAFFNTMLSLIDTNRHFEWIKSWTSENVVEEFKLISEQEKKAPKTTPAKQPIQTPKKSPAVPSKRVKQGLNTQRTSNQIVKSNSQRTNKQREKIRSQPSKSAQQLYRSAGRTQRQQFDYRGDNTPYSRSAGRSQQTQHYEDYYRAAAYSQLYTPEDYRGEISRSQAYRAEDYYGGTTSSLQPQLHRAGNYADTYWQGEQNIRAQQESRKRDWEQMNYSADTSYSQLPTSDDYSISQVPRWQEYENSVKPERYAPERKRPREEPSVVVDKPRWDDIGPLLIVWPINIRSEPEKDPRKVLEANFPTEISLERNNQVAVHVTLPVRNRRDRKYCLCVGNSFLNAAKTALDMIVKRSSIIKHSVNFLPPDGQVPNFIRYNIPCQTNPRTYIMLGWMETGPLTQEKVDELLISFKSSLNEDLFFDKDNYTHEMKLLLLDRAPKFDLKVRHFGMDHRLVDRYICVYKIKPKEEVLEEVLKMRDFHPKYKLAADKLPPRLGLNIF